MTDHPEYRANLAGIIAHPADDLRRLVLADWLEEHGEAEYAEFIRVQVELAHIGEDPHGDRYWDGQLDDGPATYRKRKALKRRERELWDYGPIREWFGVVGQDVNLGLDADYMPASSRPSFIVRRGLVAEVRVPILAAWLGGECGRCGWSGLIDPGPESEFENCPYCDGTGRVGGIGRAVCATQPVERVEVADLEPRLVSDSLGDGWTWSRATSRPADRHTIPNEVRRLLPFDHVMPLPRSRGYVRWESPSAARAALSAALISLARSESPLAVSDRNGTMSGL